MALPPNLYKLTWFWEALGQGASESLYLQRQDSNTGTVLDGVTTFLQKRAKCLGNQGTLRACRCAVVTDSFGNPPDPSISELRYFSLPGTQTTEGAENPGENIAQSVELMLYEPVAQRKKILYLGYPWENYLPGNQTFNTQSNFVGVLNQWLTEVRQGGWGWIRKVRGLPHDINDYVTDTNTGQVTVTVTGALWAQVPQKKVELSIKFANKHPLNGRHVVQPLTATSFVVVQPIGVRPFTLALGGTVRLLESFFASMNPGFPNVTNTGRIGIVQPVRRARGKPLPATRGRSATETRW